MAKTGLVWLCISDLMTCDLSTSKCI